MEYAVFHNAIGTFRRKGIIKIIILGCLCLFLMGAGLAYGPLNVKTDKLRPGELP